MNVKIFIDPPSEFYYKNILLTDSKINLDNRHGPLIFLKKKLDLKGYEVNTADYLFSGGKKGDINIYFSLGIAKNYKALAKRNDVILSSFFIFEPPVVAPNLYKKIKNISRHFKRIFVHTTENDLGRYLRGVPNVSKYYWPQPENGVITDLWSNQEREFLTLINGNKKPQCSYNELYSERIRAISYFARHNEIDLYGFGWDKYNFYWPYIANRKNILKSYLGTVKSKYEVLSRYNFAVCFENMTLSGYITEKIFDCFFVGTIPIYLGAPDIERYVPENCFINMRHFKGYPELRQYMKSLTSKDIVLFRENAHNYLNSAQYKIFTKEYFAHMILDIIREDINNYEKSLCG